jgi:hypothetical protein
MKIVFATSVAGSPMTGTVVNGFHYAQLRLCRTPDLGFLPIPGYHQTDNIRSRSGFARDFLETDADGVLWWDSDVFDDDHHRLGRLINALAKSGHDLCGAAYPRKRLHWDRVAKLLENQSGPLTVDDVKQAALQYLVVISEEVGETLVPAPVVNNFTPCANLGFGFTWTSRRCIAEMVARYDRELHYDDVQWDGTRRPTTALFQLMIRGGYLLSEDYSFCSRWRDMGGSVHLYVGPESRLQHVGQMAYGS